MTGVIKNVNSKGYGFIEDGRSIDYFFHHSKYNGDWRELVAKFVLAESKQEKLKVEFDISSDATRSPQAIKVNLI